MADEHPPSLPPLGPIMGLLNSHQDIRDTSRAVLASWFKWRWHRLFHKGPHG